MSFKVVDSAGRQYLILKQYKFCYSTKLADGTLSWRCCAKDCNSWVKTDCDQTKIKDAKVIHKHKALYSNPATSHVSSTPKTRVSPADIPVLPRSPAPTNHRHYHTRHSDHHLHSTPQPHQLQLTLKQRIEH